ncbi:MAG: lipocalin family protein [Bdellovibrionota bacterium]
MRNFQVFFTLVIISLSFLGCGESSKRKSSKPLEAVSSVDLNRYLGLWYEIARFPFGIQEGCFDTTAEYSLLKEGEIKVVNKCLKGSFDGKLDEAKGSAKVIDKETNAKLKVSFNFFMGLFGGANYWIIDLDDDYQYAVVSEPEGRYLWILSRTPKMEESVYKEILARLKDDGFLIEYLQKTPQSDR